MQVRTGGNPALSLIGGIALLVALGAVALAVALGRDDAPAGADDLSSYYFRAVIEVEQEDDVLDAVQGWYEAPDRWRYEFSSSDPARTHETVIQVSDGERLWLYDGETNTYFSDEVSEYLAGLTSDVREGGPPPPSFGVLMGPVPGGDVDVYVDALTSETRTTVTAWRAGERIAGRATERIELENEGGRRTSVWVDTEYHFFLRFDVPVGLIDGGRLTAAVEDMSFGRDIDDAVFVFEPPPLAREVELPGPGAVTGSSTDRVGSSTVSAPEGFLTPAYVPQGYVVVRIEGTHSGALGGQQTWFSVRWEKDGGDYFGMEQQFRAGGLSDSQKQGASCSRPATLSSRWKRMLST